jgi:DNA-directed RNA polymerase subunit RPC12/RpoP
MQAIINGEMYEVEPAVKVIIDKLMIENADLKKENARLEEGYQKAIGVIAATDCAECKDKPVKQGHWITDDSKIYLKHKCSECGHAVILKYPYCENCGAEMDLKDGEIE